MDGSMYVWMYVCSAWHATRLSLIPCLSNYLSILSIHPSIDIHGHTAADEAEYWGHTAVKDFLRGLELGK